jgi:hypothetical protein
MSIEKYKIEITGTGRLNNAKVYLEDENDSVRLETSDFKTWKNDEVTIDLQGNLDYKVLILARTGTDWKLIITNKATSNKVVDIVGTTGDKYPNKSVKSDSVIPR